LKELHAEKLISVRILLSWLADQLSTCNLAQLGFVVQVLGEYLAEAAEHLSLARLIVRSTCHRIQEVRHSLQKHKLLLTGRLPHHPQQEF
jgi:mediator of RNA polymerase II transcription subunit 12